MNKENVRLEPRKMNALRDWSISARALKRIIRKSIDNWGSNWYTYKFLSQYDNSHKIARVWNSKTQNVICTIKVINNKVYIRYRDKSFYSPVMSNITIENKKVYSVPSSNLMHNRGSFPPFSDANVVNSSIDIRTKLYNESKKDKNKNKKFGEDIGVIYDSFITEDGFRIPYPNNFFRVNGGLTTQCGLTTQQIQNELDRINNVR